MNKFLKIFIITVLVLVVLFGSVFFVGKASTSKKLQRTWTRTSQTEYKITTLKGVLVIDENTITYSTESFLSKKTVNTYLYKVISADKIEVDGKIYTVSFNSDDSMFTISPSLTSDDESENWFDI